MIVIQTSPECETNFQNFIDFDNELPCYAPPNDDEIVAELQSSEDDSDDEEEDSDEYIPVPSVSNALDSLSNLRSFLLSKNGCAEELEKIEQFIFSKCCHNIQTKITDFFNKY